MAIANVLVRLGEYSVAYNWLDNVVQRRPFALQARTFRAAVAALLGDPMKAIQDLPELGQTKAFNEWVGQYVRGLLLLLLNRYDAARDDLLRKVEERLLDKDARGLLNLGAAVCFLQRRTTVEQASIILNKIPDMKDRFADNIRAALQYHVAVALMQEQDVVRLEHQLSSLEDPDLRSLVSAIRRKDWRRACTLEIRTLLRLAA